MLKNSIYYRNFFNIKESRSLKVNETRKPPAINNIFIIQIHFHIKIKPWKSIIL